MDTRQALLNGWQRGFPLVREPFAAIGAALGLSQAEVLAHCRVLIDEGALGRIAGLFAAGAGGAGALAAMAVPTSRLADVAARVSAQPGVNHNYEREHRWNLWFVVNHHDAAGVTRTLDTLEAATGLPTLRLPMRRAYRIDLGFDLDAPIARTSTSTRGEAPAPLPARDWPLAALIEAGLPLLPRPFDAWAAALDVPVDAVLQRLAEWLADGTLRRFGLVVRHHELGFGANAMAVFDLPGETIDTHGAALARDACVTLAYRRERAPGWPYRLYAMVHGRDRATVREVLAGVITRAGLEQAPHELLFSRQRFKQTGAQRFRALLTEAGHGR